MFTEKEQRIIEKLVHSGVLDLSTGYLTSKEVDTEIADQLSRRGTLRKVRRKGEPDRYYLDIPRPRAKDIIDGEDDMPPDIPDTEKAKRAARLYLKKASEEGSLMEEFKQRADGKSFERQIDVADELFQKIGSGIESHVYRINSEKVLQISSKENNKIEFMVFSDTQFDEVTPDAFKHGSNWGWITMENAELISPRNPTYNRVKGIAESYVGRSPDPIGDLVASIWAGEAPESYDGNDFFDGLAKVYKKIGKRPRDMIAENFGFLDGRLKLIDIATLGFAFISTFS